MLSFVLVLESYCIYAFIIVTLPPAIYVISFSLPAASFFLTSDLLPNPFQGSVYLPALLKPFQWPQQPLSCQSQWKNSQFFLLDLSTFNANDYSCFSKKKDFFFLHLASGMLHTSVFFLSLLCRAHVLFVRKPLRVLVPPCLNLLSLSFPRWSYPVPWLEFLSGWPPNFYLQFLHLPWASNLHIQLLL